MGKRSLAPGQPGLDVATQDGFTVCGVRELALAASGGFWSRLWPVYLRHLRAFDALQTDSLNPDAAESPRVCGSVGEIDDTPGNDGSAVVHSNHDGAMVGKVGDLDQGTDGKRGVSAGQQRAIKWFTTCSGATLKSITTVPGSAPNLCPGMRRLRFFCMLSMNSRRSGSCGAGHRSKKNED